MMSRKQKSEKGYSETEETFFFHVAHCEGNYEKSIPSVSPGFITIAIGVHPSRLQIKNKILRLYQT